MASSSPPSQTTPLPLPEMGSGAGAGGIPQAEQLADLADLTDLSAAAGANADAVANAAGLTNDMTWLGLGIAFLGAELCSRFFFTRFVLRWITVGIIHVDLAAMAGIRKLLRPRYELVGDCHKCGECCRQIVASPPRLVKNNPKLLNLFALYHQIAHRFHVVGRGDDGELVFSCAYLQTDGQCSIHRTRPLLCRNYPLRPIYTPPKFLPGCSYQVAATTVTKMKRNHPRLPILNPITAVHHPSPPRDRHPQDPKNFELVDVG